MKTTFKIGDKVLPETLFKLNHLDYDDDLEGMYNLYTHINDFYGIITNIDNNHYSIRWFFKNGQEANVGLKCAWWDNFIVAYERNLLISLSNELVDMIQNYFENLLEWEELTNKEQDIARLFGYEPEDFD